MFKSRSKKTGTKTPIDSAIAMIEHAVERMEPYLEDRDYMPDQRALLQFDRLTEVLWQKHAMADYIARNMHHRFRLTPEAQRAQK